MNPFVQQPKETKLVSAAVVSSATVVSKKIVNAIVAERSRTGAVSFDEEIYAKVLVKGGWEWVFVLCQNPEFRVSVNCEKLKVQFNSSNATATAGSILPGGPRECGFSWTNDKRLNYN